MSARGRKKFSAAKVAVDEETGEVNYVPPSYFALIEFLEEEGG